jgi:hypothetical protein
MAGLPHGIPTSLSLERYSIWHGWIPISRRRISNRPAKKGKLFPRGEQIANLLKSPQYGSATQNSRGDPHTEGLGGFATKTLDDEHHSRPRLLSVHPLGLPNFPRPFPECAVDPGASPGMETDEEVALSPNSSEAGPVLQTRMHRAGSLRRELSQRAERYARTHGLPHCLIYGQTPTVCFEHYDDGSRHGNFLPATYKMKLVGAENRKAI